MDYVLVVAGEVLIGLTLGFLLSMIFAVFQTAGQFFSLQMGFGASEVFDPLAQVELPLMGELLNLVALLVFISRLGHRASSSPSAWVGRSSRCARSTWWRAAA